MILLFVKFVNSLVQKTTREEGIFIRHNHPYKELVRKIADYRYTNNTNNENIAKAAGISHAKLTAFITGTRVDDDTARAISKAIGYGIYAEKSR